MADRTSQPADDASTETQPPPSRTWKRLAGAGVAAALALFVVLALASCVFWLPKELYPSLTATDLRGVTDPAKIQDLKAERLKLQNDARTTLFQGLAAVVVLIGAGIGASMTLRQVRATRTQITETASASANQLKLSEQGQVTDRYTKAIGQLDEKNALAVRLGGLYALERIARDSPDDRGTIAEVLCAYARTAPRADPPRSAKAAEPPETDASPNGTLSHAKPSSLAFRAPDVQAALTILGRWQERLGEPPQDIDLHGAEIQGARLDEADLQYANLGGAQLQNANLYNVQLQTAYLVRAEVQNANLYSAQLQGAYLVGAQLQGANLDGANLQGASLAGANLQGASLDRGAQLQDAVADKQTCWPDGWDHTRIAAAGVRSLEAEREYEARSTGDAAQPGEEQDSSGR
jgi:Pentapeptide repeats (8 copies)